MVTANEAATAYLLDMEECVSCEARDHLSVAIEALQAMNLLAYLPMPCLSGLDEEERAVLVIAYAAARS
jgi:hypothetical protein